MEHLIIYMYVNLKCYYDKKITSSFSSDFESVIAWQLIGNILSFDFYPKAVYFECKFGISQSAIIHVQNWLIGPQRIGSREKWRHLLTSLLCMQDTSLKAWKPETPVLHINSATYTCIAFLNYCVFDITFSIQLSQD